MSDQKYKILKDNFITYDGHKLHRILALKDFSDIQTGDVGGYIESEQNLSQFVDC